MEKLRENIKKELLNRGWTAYDLAEASNVSQPTINRFLNEKHQELKARSIKLIANAFNMTEAEIMGLVPLENRKINEHAQKYVIEKKRSKLKNVPILSNAQLGDNGHWTDMDYPAGFGDGYITYPTNDENAYAVRCVGDSMKPRIKNGEFVVLLPNETPNPGDEILIKSYDGRVMIKTLLYIRDNMLHVMSINESFPPQSIPLKDIENIHYVAAIIKSHSFIKS